LKYPSSYFLVTHGSRDPRPQVALEKLAALVLERLAGNYNQTTLPLVGTGTLEFGPVSLAEQLQQFADKTRVSGLSKIQVIPLFLLSGVHVTDDIPEQVEQAQKALGNAVKIEILPHLGGEPERLDLLANQQANKTAERWILLSHGSRRTSANQIVENMAEKLGAVAAYWSVEPSLEQRLKELVEAGYQKIAILPYFLFSGGITDAISQTVEQFSLNYPSVNLVLTETLEANPQLANIITNLIEKYQ
jgi:sirohydrochlorin ferrochelatase